MLGDKEKTSKSYAMIATKGSEKGFCSESSCCNSAPTDSNIASKMIWYTEDDILNVPA